jgi:hypothetical protein
VHVSCEIIEWRSIRIGEKTSTKKAIHFNQRKKYQEKRQFISIGTKDMFQLLVGYVTSKAGDF